MSFNEASRSSEAVQDNSEGLRGGPVSFMGIQRSPRVYQKVSEELQCVLGCFKESFELSEGFQKRSKAFQGFMRGSRGFYRNSQAFR